jgi:putative ABC transport system ATP-binding protein
MREPVRRSETGMQERPSDPTVEITCVGVEKSYQMGEVLVPVLRGIDLEIRKGELTVVCGASGSGKSTLLNMIGGVDRPTAGEVWFDGADTATFSDRRLTEYRRQCIGFVFQFYNLVPTLTALENVEVSTEIADSPMDPREALEKVDLADKTANFPAQLSGGEQQRVAIARALAKNPRLMLCDEPVGSLDFETGQRVLATLARLNDEIGATIVIVTHASPLADLAHSVIRLGSGRVVETRTNERRARVEDIRW